MRRMLVLLVLTAATAVAAAAPAEALADGGCERLSLTGQASLDPASGKIEGTFVGTMGGRPVSIFSSTTVLDQRPLGSALLLSTAHAFTFADGRRLETADRALLVPTATPGVYHAFSRLELVSGAGGWILGIGTIDFRAGVEASWRWVEGRICAG